MAAFGYYVQAFGYLLAGRRLVTGGGAGGAPANALTFEGEPLTFEGEYLTYA